MVDGGGQNLRIVFVEPGASPVPVGGTRIVYEYANGLAARGHAVSVIHPVRLERSGSGLKQLRLSLRHAAWGLTGRWSPARWMTVHSGVRSLWVDSLKPGRFPDADIVVATTWNTVAPILRLPDRCGAKAFFAQSWDFGSAPEEPLRAAWAAPVTRIVNNRAMRAAAAEQGWVATYVPNGVSADGFGIDTPVAERGNHVAMLYHPAPYKGSADALAALAIARRRAPYLSAEMFGARPRPSDIPDWIAYRRLPTREALRALYNRAAVFISASTNESWGLAPCEAGHCGAALAVTDNFGHREYARDGETALVGPPGDPAVLAANILRLLGDAGLRSELNTGLRETLATFSWSRSVEAMEQALTGGA